MKKNMKIGILFLVFLGIVGIILGMILTIILANGQNIVSNITYYGAINKKMAILATLMIGGFGIGVFLKRNISVVL